MKHLFLAIGTIAVLYLIMMFAAGLSGQADMIEIGREIMTAGWSLAGALGF